MWSLRKKLLVWGCSTLALVIVIVAVGIGIAWRHLNGNIKAEDASLKPSVMSGKQDILFIGSDSRAGPNQSLGGGDVSGARSDTTMVFDSPADRSKATEVVLDAAIQSITTDPGVGTTVDLYNLARALSDIPNRKIGYVTVPNEPYRSAHYRR